jgi:hypothetical protein
MRLSDKDKLEQFPDKYLSCACGNVIEFNQVHCPYCKKFNVATSISHCPTCNQPLVK